MEEQKCLTVNELIQKLKELVEKNPSFGEYPVNYPEFGALYKVMAVHVYDHIVVINDDS